MSRMRTVLVYQCECTVDKNGSGHICEPVKFEEEVPSCPYCGGETIITKEGKEECPCCGALEGRDF